MRGEVLYYDEEQGFGFIHGEDGERYTFTREDLGREDAAGKGTRIEFEPQGSAARNILVLRAQPAGVAPAAPGSAADAPPTIQPGAHFGRLAREDDRQSATGLWGYFWRAVTTNYVNFAGRARRKEYWGYVLFWLLTFMVLMVVCFAVDGATMEPGGRDLPIVSFGVLGTYVVGTLFPGIALSVRRLHDIGLPGWLVLVAVIPLGWIAMLVVALWPTQRRENRWGPVPEGVSA